MELDTLQCIHLVFECLKDEEGGQGLALGVSMYRTAGSNMNLFGLKKEATVTLALSLSHTHTEP